MENMVYRVTMCLPATGTGEHQLVGQTDNTGDMEPRETQGLTGKGRKG